MDPRFRRVLRPISAVTVVVFTLFATEWWNFAFAAQAPSRPKAAALSHPKSSAGRFEENLRGVQKLIKDMDQDLSGGKDISLALEGLKGHKNNLESADVEIRSEFAETEAFLKEKNLPQVILDRQTKAVSDYDKNYKKLKGDLDAILTLDSERKAAKDRGDRETAETRLKDLKARIRSIRDDLETKVQKPRHQPLDPNNLPHRAAKPTKRKPRLKKEEFTEFLPDNKPVPVSYNGEPPDIRLASHTPGIDLPTPADLAETIEVKFTVEINELASSLDHNPVKIYNWVHNNIDFTPTWGSIQGANHCLLTKQCNAFDTSSLLIALLRTSGIPARYVMGTIEVPIDQFMNWVGGFTDANAALTFAASGGIPTTGLQQGGTIKAVRLEHVWVTAYVDMNPSFGAIQKEGDTWVPLDSSFKEYTYGGGIDFDAVTSFDFEGFVNQLQSSATINQAEISVTSIGASLVESSLTDILGQLQAYIDQNIASPQSGAVFGAKNIIEQSLTIIVESLPYKTIMSMPPFTEISQIFRHKVTFELYDSLGLGTDFSITKTLPEIAGDKVALSYAPASPSDETFVISYFNSEPTSLAAYLIHLTPELVIDGQTVATGQQIRMGEEQKFIITLTSPNFVLNRAFNSVTAGTYNAVVFDLGIVGPNELFKAEARNNTIKGKVEANDLFGITKHDIIGEFLHGIGLGYWGFLDLVNDLSSRVDDVVYARLPSAGVFTHALKVDYAFGVPVSGVPFGFIADIDSDIQIVGSKMGNQIEAAIFLSKAGILGSNFEASVFDLAINGTYTGRGISTTHLLERASNLGIPIFFIDSGNLGTILPILELTAEVKDDIRNGVNAGLVVAVPKSEMTKDNWTGVGYMILDRDTGAGAYRISGGLSGGAYSCGCFGNNPVLELLMGISLVTAGIKVNPIMIAVLSVIAAYVGYKGTVCEIRSRNDLDALQKDVLEIIAAMIYTVSAGIAVGGAALLFFNKAAAPALVSATAILMTLYWLQTAFAIGLIIEMIGNFFVLFNEQRQSAYNIKEIRKKIYA